ncbi:UBP-type zinc finger domain-containing protein, partial [Candidatus Nanopelagicales bacterium]|nr:UBP-type zinc finger domain-containing protein [Candidatus Nanopelagicales bacterium]
VDTADKPILPAVVARLEGYVRDRKHAAWELVATPGDSEAPVATYSRLRLKMLHSERTAVVAARDTGKYDDEVIRRVIRVLDVEEAMLDTPAITAAPREKPLEASQCLGANCQHLAAVQNLSVPAVLECGDCVREGTVPVHLRMCLTCGTVACCDSSEGQHAHRHNTQTGHPVIRSVEPGEAWRWCYEDETLGAATENPSV